MAACPAHLVARGCSCVEPEFDSTKTVIVTGKLLKMEWSNPHVYVNVEVIRTDGSKEIWIGELGAAQAYAAQGWTPDRAMAIIGQTVTLRGNPHKRELRLGLPAILTTATGDSLSPPTTAR
jgi:hypothetical protein